MRRRALHVLAILWYRWVHLLARPGSERPMHLSTADRERYNECIDMLLVAGAVCVNSSHFAPEPPLPRDTMLAPRHRDVALSTMLIRVEAILTRCAATT